MGFRMFIMHGMNGWFVKVTKPPGDSVRLLEYSEQSMLEKVALDLREGKGVLVD